MKAVKYSVEVPSFHIHMNNSYNAIYIPEKDAIIFEASNGTFGPLTYGITTYKASIELAQKVFNCEKVNETEEEYEARDKKLQDEEKLKAEQYRAAHPNDNCIFAKYNAERMQKVNNIVFIDIEIDDFDKLKEIYDGKEVLNTRLKEIIKGK